jgi:predicted alpha/beta-hydrolase family hydrolase
VRELIVSWDGGAASTTARLFEASTPASTIVLAHGAGAGQHSAFMVNFAEGLSSHGMDVVTFNFLYTEQHRRVPDRAPVLEACYRAVIDVVLHEVGSAPAGLIIGGKSMGGRIATQVAAADRSIPLSGLVLLGYPLHPPGRPEKKRDEHLPLVGRPMLIVQGARDTFGTPEELRPVLERIDPKPTLRVVDGGDHSFKTSRGDPAMLAATYAEIQNHILNWARDLTRTVRN